MTLVVAATTRRTAWLMTDRRLTFKDRPPTDDAIKLVSLQCTDGVALIGYAGLGSTVAGTKVADWVNGVLVGRNWPLEGALSALASAGAKALPPHLQRLRPGSPWVHNFVVPAFKGGEARIYSIDFAGAGTGGRWSHRYTSHVFHRNGRPQGRPPRMTCAGSGAKLASLREHAPLRGKILALMHRFDAGRVAADDVFRAFAELNHAVSQLEPTVGSRCVITYRNTPQGGSHAFFDSVTHEITCGDRIPQIAHGMDIQEFVAAALPVMRLPRSPGDAMPPIDVEAMNRALANLTNKPRDDLR